MLYIRTSQSLDREQSHRWVVEHRLPLFLHSDLYSEYNLCRLLTSARPTPLPPHAPRQASTGRPSRGKIPGYPFSRDGRVSAEPSRSGATSLLPSLTLPSCGTPRQGSSTALSRQGPHTGEGSHRGAAISASKSDTLLEGYRVGGVLRHGADRRPVSRHVRSHSNEPRSSWDDCTSADEITGAVSSDCSQQRNLRLAGCYYVHVHVHAYIRTCTRITLYIVTA